MSSEYSIHLHDKPIEGQVSDLGPQSGIMVTVSVAAPTNAAAGVRLFLDKDRLLEASLLFHKLAQDLAALLPDVDACCRCVPGTPDDQCAEHGFGAFKIKRAASPDASDDPARCSGCGGLLVHNAGCLDTVPIEEAAEYVEPPHRWG